MQPHAPKLLDRVSMRRRNDRLQSVGSATSAADGAGWRARGAEPEDPGGFADTRKPRRLPVVLTQAEVGMMFSKMSGTPLLVANLLYGGELRLMEALRHADVRTTMIYTHVLQRMGGRGVRSPSTSSRGGAES